MPVHHLETRLGRSIGTGYNLQTVKGMDTRPEILNILGADSISHTEVLTHGHMRGS